MQAANASNSTTDRQKLNNEASQLVAEIDRVAQNTNFNGLKLLDGTFTSQTLQVGANAGGSNQISIDKIASARSASLGVGSGSSYAATIANTGSVSVTNLTASGLVTINGFNVGATVSDGVSLDLTGTTAVDESAGSAIAKAAAINAISGDSGVTATVNSTTLSAAIVGGSVDDASLTLNGVSLGTIQGTGNNSGAAVVSSFVAAVNAVSDSTGVSAEILSATAGTYRLTAADGRNINLVQDTATLGATASFASDGTAQATITLASNSSNGITIGGDTASVNALGITAVGNTAATVTVGAGVSSVDLTTAAGASNALAIIDSAIENIANSRADLGAFQNRLESTISNLNIQSENLSASRGRIQDADFAAETANLSRSQILQQAGTAILAQANALPQSVLSLLQ